MLSADDRIAADLGKAVMTAHRQGEFIEAAQKQLLASYELLAQCIRSDQVPDVAAVLEADPAFAAWYRAKFLNPTDAAKTGAEAFGSGEA